MDQGNRDLLGHTAQYSEVSDPYQSFGQDMKEKPADKLQVVQTHLQLLGSLTVILVPKSDRLGVNIQNPVIGDGHLLGVPAQIFQDSLWMAKRLT